MPDGSPVLAWANEPAGGATMQTAVWKPSGCDGTWEQMGAPVADAYFPALAVVPSTGQTVRASVRSTTPETIVVERWNGSTFQAMGNPFTTSGNEIRSPRLAIDASGAVIVAWADSFASSNARVRAARWDGAAWTDISGSGGVLGAFLYSGTPPVLSIATTPAGTPVVAFATTGFATLVAKYGSGTSWSALGPPPAMPIGTGGVNGPIVAINGAGDPFVISMSRTMASVYRASVARFDGTNWQAVGDAPGTGYSDVEHNMAIAPDGAPVVVIGGRAVLGSRERLSFYRRAGGAWQALPSPTDGAPAAADESSPIIAVGAGNLIAVWMHAVGGASQTRAARTRL